MRYNSGVRQAGIYIHIPFCERKCTYCNFNTTDFFEGLAARYVGAVKEEIVWWGRRLEEQQPVSAGSAANRIKVDTIYFGGGTPSIVEAEQLASLVEACRGAFEVSRDAEITIEINPATLERSKLEMWLSAGINRASVGVQSFIDRELVSLSRTHTAETARGTVAVLREGGFNNVSLDLIAGLPDQTLEDWESNLREALELRPEHLSLYLLEVKEGTQLFSQIKRGQRPAPDDDLAAEMYRSMCEAAQGSGYEHYEISNFALFSGATDRFRETAEETSCFGEPQSAKPGKNPCALAEAGLLRSKHNLKYWTGAPFYGMGCGAHSYDGRARWVNTFKTEHYIEKVALSGHAIGERHELSADERAADALFMGLRLREGIDLADFRAEYEMDVLKRYAGEFPALLSSGLIELNEGRLMLTDAGRLLSNEVFVHFV
jgi:oxygen-independent coproporphyrinogen-3 oxidase